MRPSRILANNADAAMLLYGIAKEPWMMLGIVFAGLEYEGWKDERCEAQIRRNYQCEVAECLVKTGDIVAKGQLLGVVKIVPLGRKRVKGLPEEIRCLAPYSGEVVNAPAVGAIVGFDEKLVEIKKTTLPDVKLLAPRAAQDGSTRERIHQVANTTAVIARGTASAASWVARQAEKAAQRLKAKPEGSD